MSEEKNYNESVIIPFLQRKVQELSNQNLILEVNLLIERQKNSESENELNKIKNELNDLQNQLIESGLAEEVADTPTEPLKKKRKVKSSTEILDASTY